MKFKNSLFFSGYILTAVLIFLYSYTQVDLNLTLSRQNFWQAVQKFFQNIGYFQRPLSTWLYLGIISLLFGLYIWALSLIKHGKMTVRQFWRLIIATSIILVFSYPAFSYDIFNYMFTAKTVLVYRQNPYLVLPLQFAGVDPWINVMRWVHLPSAYSPLWILLTLPAYILGFGFFLTIMWSIKLMVAAFHLFTIWGIGKVLEKVEPKQKLLGMAIFALNPLIIIEDLVSGHNDVVMLAFMVWAIFLFFEKKKLTSWFVASLSVATKLITVAVLPGWFFISKKNWRGLLLAAMLMGFFAVIATREVLPWYWVWVMPFIALLPSQNKLTIFATGVSLGLLLRYAPYLYLGNWDPPALLFKNIGTLLPIIAALFLSIF